MSFPEGWPAGDLRPRELPIRTKGDLQSMPYLEPLPKIEMTIWIKVGDTQIKRIFRTTTDLDRCLRVFTGDWHTLLSRSDRFPKDRTTSDPAWFEITVWVETPAVDLQDYLETIDLEAGKAFIATVHEAWEKVITT